MESECPEVTAHVQYNMNPHILLMFKGTFLGDVAHNKFTFQGLSVRLRFSQTRQKYVYM